MVTPEVMKDTVLIDGGLVAMQFMLATVRTVMKLVQLVDLKRPNCRSVWTR